MIVFSFKKKKSVESSLDPPISLPDLARDKFEKQRTDEQVDNILEGKEKTVHEPTAQPNAGASFANKLTKGHLPEEPEKPVSIPEPVQQPAPQKVLPPQPVQQPVPGYPPQYPYPIFPPMPQYMPMPQPMPQYFPYPQVLPPQPMQAGFFQGVAQTFDKGAHGAVKEQVGNVMHRLKEHHGGHDKEDFLQHTVLSSLNDLQQLELSWKQTRESLEEKERECSRKEREIEHKVAELELFMEHLQSHKRVKKAVSPDQWFRCNDGRKFGSVIELKQALPTMSDETFHHHVTFDRNDFASWVADIFQELSLADKVRGVSSRMALFDVLNKVI